MALRIEEEVNLISDGKEPFEEELEAAKQFARRYQTYECSLCYKGFLFDVTENMNIPEKVKEYRKARG
jgi:patatin-like phospholipase/acyl hydrolase